MKKEEIKNMTCEEIAALLRKQRNTWDRRAIIALLYNDRMYDRAVYHAAWNFSVRKNGTPNWAAVNSHVEKSIIDPKDMVPTGAGWQTVVVEQQMMFRERGQRGANKGFLVKGREIKRILLEDGPVPKARLGVVA